MGESSRVLEVKPGRRHSVFLRRTAQTEALVHMHSSVWINKSIWCCWSVLSSVSEAPISLICLSSPSLFHCSLSSLALSLPPRHPAFSPNAPTSPQCNFPSFWVYLSLSPSASLSLSLSLSLCDHWSINNSAYGSGVGRQAACWRQANTHCWPKHTEAGRAAVAIRLSTATPAKLPAPRS